MCYFVHIALPKEHAELIRAWPHDDFRVAECRSATLLAQLPRAWAVFTVTDPSGHCSCGLYRAVPQRFDEERERARYRARGWSKSKIDRAVAGRRPKQTRRDRFVERVAQLVEACDCVEICTVDGHETEVVAFPRADLMLDAYLAESGTHPHSMIVRLRAARTGNAAQ